MRSSSKSDIRILLSTVVNRTDKMSGIPILPSQFRSSWCMSSWFCLQFWRLVSMYRGILLPWRVFIPDYLPCWFILSAAVFRSYSVSGRDIFRQSRSYQRVSLRPLSEWLCLSSWIDKILSPGSYERRTRCINCCSSPLHFDSDNHILLLLLENEK